MKAALRLLALLATTLSACRATAPAERNTLPRHQPLTEAATPERAEPSRPPRPDTSALPPHPQN
ncbi:hypothetical protein [Hymenobacter rubidus]|uniref:hypothetical protein n=1 Tax=Hymenobacter rubidus TaxID=1441626 RepID=UPI001F3C9F31|nr:hypothetical protein [Hymenobacter rubidus]